MKILFTESDTRPVVHGKWVKNKYGIPMCSVCGGSQMCDHGGHICKSNFCPNCGADMREVEM